MKSTFLRLLFCLFTFAFCLLFCLPKTEAAAPNWTITPANFQYSMTGIIRVKMDGAFLNATTTRLAAFVNGQIRGVVLAPTMNSGNAYFPITMYSNIQSGETLTFQVYVVATDAIHPASESATFNRAVSLGTPPAPFILNIYEAIVLPIELAEFSAKTIENGQNARLDWRTASETDNAGFEIERSADGHEFEKIGFVEGQNRAATYRFLDENPLAGRSFYRLRQVGFDGNVSFSPVRSVEILVRKRLELETAMGGFWLFSDSEMGIRLRVLTAPGRLLFEKTADATAFFSNENWTSGVFFVVAERGDGAKTTAVFAKI